MHDIPNPARDSPVIYELLRAQSGVNVRRDIKMIEAEPLTRCEFLISVAEYSDD